MAVMYVVSGGMGPAGMYGVAGGVRGLRGIMECRVSGGILGGSGVGGVRGPAGH